MLCMGERYMLAGLIGRGSCHGRARSKRSCMAVLRWEWDLSNMALLVQDEHVNAQMYRVGLQGERQKGYMSEYITTPHPG